jgi:rod shape-determining protein MreB
VAGTKFDEAVLEHMRKKHNLVIGERTSEDIKIRIGNAFVDGKEEAPERLLEVKGRDFQTGLPKVMEVGEKSVHESLQRPLKQILEGIKEVLAQTPPELAADIVDKGIVLSGGSSLLTNFDKYITYYTGVAAFVVDEPLFCVIRGIGMAIDNPTSYQGVDIEYPSDCDGSKSILDIMTARQMYPILLPLNQK